MNIKTAAQRTPGVESSELRSLLAGIEAGPLREWVTRFARPRHSLRNPSANRKTAGWIADLLRGWSYEVSMQGPHRNVVAHPRGQSGACFVVGAHYDSVPTTPGADDNASAVAAMLGCAAACARWPRALPVLFVAFNGEEDGMLGSQDFVTSFLPRSGHAVRCAHILEMVGYADHREGSQTVPPGLPISLPTRGEFLGLLANAPSAPAMDHVLLAACTYVPGFPVLGLEVMRGLEQHFPVLHRSDHAPFWAEGLPAVMWTDTAEFRNPHYHAETDTAETLDYEFLRQVTQVLLATVISQAESFP